ncbi:MAG: arsinothricin resistance N-acetyltransferase ArsN1 family B [Pseudomonadota bacterium]
MEIRDAEAGDAAAIADIYNHYIANTRISFEEKTLAPLGMASRLKATQANGLPWLVAQADDRVIGYAYADKWRERHAYRYVVEVSVYLGPDHFRKGFGARLYEALFDQLKSLGYHAVLACIALPNPASVALHEKLGMQKCAHFNEVGYKFGEWVDVGYWQGVLKNDGP